MIIRVRFVKLSTSGEKDYSTITQWVCYSEKAVETTTFYRLFDKIHSGIFILQFF